MVTIAVLLAEPVTFSTRQFVMFAFPLSFPNAKAPNLELISINLQLSTVKLPFLLYNTKAAEVLEVESISMKLMFLKFHTRLSP